MRMIDADAIDYKHHKQHKHGKFNTDLLGDAKTLEDAFYKGVMYIHNCIEETPTADVIEIVRCKDCKHYTVESSVCKRMNRVMKSDGFCSNGERREDD